MVRAGDLRQLLMIQEPTTTQGAMGGPTETWSTFAEPWGKVVPTQGQESFREERERATVRYETTVRYVDGVTPQMRILEPRELTTVAAILNSTGTTLTVASAAAFPSSADYRIKIDSELLEVTAGQGTTSWTVTRAVDGTTGAAHSTGAAVERMVAHDILSAVDPTHRRAALRMDTEVAV